MIFPVEEEGVPRVGCIAASSSATAKIDNVNRVGCFQEESSEVIRRVASSNEPFIETFDDGNEVAGAGVLPKVSL